MKQIGVTEKRPGKPKRGMSGECVVAGMRRYRIKGEPAVAALAP